MADTINNRAARASSTVDEPSTIVDLDHRPLVPFDAGRSEVRRIVGVPTVRQLAGLIDEAHPSR